MPTMPFTKTMLSRAGVENCKAQVFPKLASLISFISYFANRVNRAGCDGLETSIVLEPMDEAPADAHDREWPENPAF